MRESKKHSCEACIWGRGGIALVFEGFLSFSSCVDLSKIPSSLQHGLLEGFSVLVASWKNPKKHRLMGSGHQWECGNTFYWPLQSKLFIQKMEGHGQWLRGGLIKVGKQEMLPAGYKENLQPSDSSNFTNIWITNKKHFCHKTVWTFLPPERIYNQQL